MAHAALFIPSFTGSHFPGLEERLSWLIQPLGPTLVLLMGALALMLLRSSPWRRWASICALSANLGALIILAMLRSPQAVIAVGRPWTSVLFDFEGGLAWRVNAWSWVGGWVIVSLSLVVILLTWEEGGRLAPYYQAADLTLAAMAVIVTFSANLLTLASMWVLMESVAVTRLALEPTHQPETGRVGLSAASVLLMALVCALAGTALLVTPLSDAPLTPLAQALLLMAIMLRSAAYPFHGWLHHSRLSSPTDRLSVYLIPAVAGLWLLGQINSTADMAWLGEPQWWVLITLFLLGSSIAAWTELDTVCSLAMVCANRAGVIILAMSLWPGQGILPLVGWLLAFSLGLGMLLVAYLVNQSWGGRWPAVLAVLTLLGYPATAGFIGQAWIARLAPPTGYLLFWTITVLADSLLLATLLRGWERPIIPLPERVSRREARLLTATVVLAVPAVFAGLQPAMMLRLIGIEAPQAGLLTLVTSMPSSIWARLLVVSALALWLNYSREPALIRWERFQEGVARVARLDWVYGLVQITARAAWAFWQAVLRIVEGEGYMGWVALTLLLILLLVRR